MQAQPTKNVQMPVADVKPGMLVVDYGYAWRVRANRFDPIGNGSHDAPAPRHVLECFAEPGQECMPPGGYAEHMTLGRGVGGTYTVVMPLETDETYAIIDRDAPAALDVVDVMKPGEAQRDLYRRCNDMNAKGPRVRYAVELRKGVLMK